MGDWRVLDETVPQAAEWAGCRIADTGHGMMGPVDAVSKVFLVDDDEAMRRALERLLRAEGLDVRSFAGARDFLERLSADDCGCLLLDVAMPGMDGLALQHHLSLRPMPLPVVFLTGHGDIPMSVRAIKAGATDFLTKPVERTELMRAVRAALTQAQQARSVYKEKADLLARIALLTPRERVVLEHVISGRLNKVIAAQLGTTEQTIKVHRGRVMEKLEVSSLAELVRLAEQAGISPAR